MNIGRLLDFGPLGRPLPKALRQVSHTAIDRAATRQRRAQQHDSQDTHFIGPLRELIQSQQEVERNSEHAKSDPAACLSLPGMSCYLAGFSLSRRKIGTDPRGDAGQPEIIA
jgi:hypothetical protein